MQLLGESGSNNDALKELTSTGSFFDRNVRNQTLEGTVHTISIMMTLSCSPQKWPSVFNVSIRFTNIKWRRLPLSAIQQVIVATRQHLALTQWQALRKYMFIFLIVLFWCDRSIHLSLSNVQHHHCWSELHRHWGQIQAGHHHQTQRQLYRETDKQIRFTRRRIRHELWWFKTWHWIASIHFTHPTQITRVIWH